MPISPDAVDRYLVNMPAMPPKIKGMPRYELMNLIKTWTGHEYTWHGVEPRQTQIEGLAFCIFLQQALLFYDMRTGKTKISLDFISHIKKMLPVSKQRALIIAHSPLGLDNWLEQIKLHSELNFYTAESGKNSLEKFVDAISDDTLDGVVTPWSTLQQIFTVKRVSRKGENKLYVDEQATKMASEFFSIGVIDEIHMCKNHYSLRYQIAKGLMLNCPFRVGMTGTPIGNNALDVWAGVDLIDNGRTFGKSYHFFESAFGKQIKSWVNPRGFEVVFDNKKMPQLMQKLKAVAISCKLSDVQETNVIANQIPLHMSGPQKIAYQDLIVERTRLTQSRILAEANGEVPPDQKSFYNSLRRVASGYMEHTDRDGVKNFVTFPKSAKLDWFKEFIEQKQPEIAVVVFHEFVQTGNILTRVLDKMKINYATINGHTTNRAVQLNRFKTGAVDWLIANSASGGVGIDLARADYMLFYESTTSPILRQQVEARPLARGARLLLMDDLVCAPVEHVLLEALREGRDIMTDVTYGNLDRFRLD